MINENKSKLNDSNNIMEQECSNRKHRKQKNKTVVIAGEVIETFIVVA